MLPPDYEQIGINLW